jgi:hypothetical protein
MESLTQFLKEWRKITPSGYTAETDPGCHSTYCQLAVFPPYALQFVTLFPLDSSASSMYFMLLSLCLLHSVHVTDHASTPPHLLAHYIHYQTCCLLYEATIPTSNFFSALKLDAASCSEMPVRVPVNIVTKGHLLAR